MNERTKTDDPVKTYLEQSRAVDVVTARLKLELNDCLQPAI